MNSLATLIGQGIRVNYRMKSAVLVMLGLMVFFLALVLVLLCALVLIPQLRAPEPDHGEIGRYLGLILYSTALIAMGMHFNVFTANNLVKEKAQRIHESILAGPVGLRTLWAAKSLAVFLPGFIMAELLVLGVFLGLNGLLLAPRLGFLASPSLVASGFLLVPLLYLPLSFLVLLVGLSGNPVSANVIAQVLFSVLITLTINLVVRAGLDVSSPLFIAIHLGMALLIGVLIFLIRSRLSKERVVLSAGVGP